ncbi:MAG: hypothetical protein H7301_06260, partial [Cryobacterium sp.]|nr:hypothetical protein [Oligoflexia bacterium]
MAKLSNLLSLLDEEIPRLFIERDFSPKLLDTTITKVTSDSRAVGEGTLYVAVVGTLVDGHSFLPEVFEKGVTFVIGERSAAELGVPADRYLQVTDSRLALGLVASEMERNPSREMLMIGITGTSGKTTISYLVESILRAAGKKVGLIGTVAYRLDGVEIPSTHTTPGPVELQQLLHRMHFEGATAVVMEVSSHALKQSRAAGVAFDGGIFTNLSAEHLDYHPDMEDYFESKKLLFTTQAVRSQRWGKSPRFAIHSASPHGARLFSELAAGDFGRETTSF